MSACPLYDAHNHLQDRRLIPHLAEIRTIFENISLKKCVINGTSPDDWARVKELAAEHHWIIPSAGLHPWYLRERPADWESRLEGMLDSGSCAVGEIGLDRWMPDPDLCDQEQVFLAQLKMAAERGLPVTIHCLKAWGLLFELVRKQFRSNAGFLLHSYGGPEEMVRPLAALGAYFSISGYFFHERKARQRETFKRVPIERLLIETDAPDMLPPPGISRFQLRMSGGEELNHPGNIVSVYQATASSLGLPFDELAAQIQSNFQRLFAPVLKQPGE